MTLEQTPQWMLEFQNWLWEPAPFTQAPRSALLGVVLGMIVLAALSTFFFSPRVRRWWADDTSRPDEDERGVSIVEMTLIEHLLELRNRLVWSSIALLITTVVAFVFFRKWMDIALWPILSRCDSSQGACLQAITPTETVFAYFQVTLVVGLIWSMPVIAYQLWAFMAPGLTRQERRYVIAVIPGATVSFVLGVAFAYFAIIPAALSFLLGFGDVNVDIKPTIASYISFITRLLVAVGLIFEMPLVMYFLAKVNVINAKMLGGMRRYVIVAAFVVAAVVTPTPDPFNQLLVAIPILVLYEVGVLLSRVAR